MKFKLILAAIFVLIAQTAFADLSLITKWRIEQAASICEGSQNAIKYPKYWQGNITEENRQTLCVAEQFTDLVMLEGDEWLEKKSGEYFEQCKKESGKDQQKYYACLEKVIDSVTTILSAPCKELGAMNLWKKDMCHRLIKYVFVKKFEPVFEKSKPLHKRFQSKIDRIKYIPWVKIVFHPIMAVIFLFVYVLDIVLFIDPGNWLRVSKTGLIMGLVILASCFVAGGLKYFISGGVSVTLISIVAWNHILDAMAPNKHKRRRYIK